MKLTTSVRWEVEGITELNPRGWYLILSNHQSWLDILVLGIAFNGKIPMLKFFMKKQLIWIPFLGVCCYALGFPFMGRYSKEYLKKHPEKKGEDIKATRKACEKFKTIPTTIINFCEGTRFTQAKHDRQVSPFQHLLKPKAGGTAFVLSIMGEYLHQLLDVTLIYPQHRVSLWQLCCGQVERIIIKVRLLPVQPELIGDYENDNQFRRNFQKWLNELWQEKEMTIMQALNRPTLCKHYFIRGKVQGVWYRANTVNQAKKYHITGWAKNLADGCVEVVACGKEVDLMAFEAWLHQGPPGASVDQVAIEIILPQIFYGFQIK